MKIAKAITSLAALLILSGAVSLSGQSRARVSGFVRDGASGELLIGATVVDTLSGAGAETDYSGYFTIVASPGATLRFSFPGYRKQYLPVADARDTLLNVALEPTTAIDEVVVTVGRHKSADISTLSPGQLMGIPSIGGKPDVGRALQLLPGIGTQNEGSSVLLVRGGDPGHNMYLFDNIPVIHVNHLGGFFSVFNPEIINNIDVYKGGFPARYGGRLSSIVDITQREGNSSGTRGSFSIGLTDLSFTVEGPLTKNATFIVTGRKTLIDAIMALFTGVSDSNYFIAFYGFHDLNGKLTWKPDARNTFSLNLYYGDDYLSYSNKRTNSADDKFRFANTWGNWLVSGHWKSVISREIFASSSISYTRYRLREIQKYWLTDDAGTQQFFGKTISSVDNAALKTELKYTPFNSWTVAFGGEATLSNYRPFSYSFNGKADRASSILSGEGGLFVDNTVSFLRYSTLRVGARLAGYATKDFRDIALEPRVSASLGFGAGQFMTLGYMNVNQYSHLLFTSGDIMNNEVWVPAGNGIAPSRSEQYSAGWQGNFRGGMISAELVFYYKTMTDLATYREGFSNLPGDMDWRSKVETGGSGTAKGMELLINKNAGALTGFISYSLSNATRRYPGIDGGREFVFDYDRPHRFAISANYKINDKLSVSATWTYMTGLPFTPAVGLTTIPPLSPGEDYEKALLYGERNSARMRDYHRLDVGLTYETLTKRNRRAVWNFSVYNLYNRKNPYYYYYNTHGGDTVLRPGYEEYDKPFSLYQISFFPIIPTVSYTLFFDGNGNRTKSTFKQKMRNLLYYKD